MYKNLLKLLGECGVPYRLHSFQCCTLPDSSEVCVKGDIIEIWYKNKQVHTFSNIDDCVKFIMEN